MRKIGQIFEGPRGEVSSKRVFALGCFIVASIVALQGGDPTTSGAFLASASAVFIGASISKT